VFGAARGTVGAADGVFDWKKERIEDWIRAGAVAVVLASIFLVKPCLQQRE
jgi:hypothetical protein